MVVPLWLGMGMRNFLGQPTISGNVCIFFFFFSGCAAWLAGSYFPSQGTEPRPWQWKPRVLTTGPPGNFQEMYMSWSEWWYMDVHIDKNSLALKTCAPFLYLCNKVYMINSDWATLLTTYFGARLCCHLLSCSLPSSLVTGYLPQFPWCILVPCWIWVQPC